MKFLRDSLTKKAILLFTFLVSAIVIAGIVMIRRGVETVPMEWFLGVAIGLLFLILLGFILDVMVPLGRVAKQIKNLLTGKNYQRVEPTTIDEIGVMTHFFNEITLDLEKISYDVKERRRMSSELDIAAQIQKDVLPKEAPESAGLDIVAKNRSAAEVGGDCFDLLASPDGKQNLIYVGDVTGHGVPAGLVMMMVDTLITTMVSMGLKSGRDLLVNTNTLLTPRISARLFMTLVMLRWDTDLQKMYYTGAGHEHVLVYRAKTEKVEAIKSGGIALGMVPDNSKILKEAEILLEVGDAVVLYTDGLTEAKSQAGEMFGLERMIDSLNKHGYLPSAESIFDHLTQDFSNFVGEYVQKDDTTMIVIKYTGKDKGAKMKLEISKDETAKKSAKWDWAG